MSSRGVCEEDTEDCSVALRLLLDLLIAVIGEHFYIRKQCASGVIAGSKRS